MMGPVRFSVARMLSAVTLFCVGVWLSTFIWRYGGQQHDLVSLIEVITAGMAIGGATGLILGEPIAFTVLGFAFAGVVIPIIVIVYRCLNTFHVP